MLLLANIFVFIAVYSLIYYFIAKEKSTLMQQTEENKEKAVNFFQPFKVFSPIVNVAAKRGLPIENLKGKLISAGLKIGVAEFIGLKLVLGFLAFLVGMILFKNYLIVVGILTLAGFLMPDIWLKNKIKRRHFEIARDLPHIMDMLTLCVDAGLDFMLALRRVAAEFRKCPISDELKEVLHEVSIGKQRKDALKNMADRVNMPETSSFVRALIQAEKMGTPVADILTIQAEELRLRRFQRGEELALKAPIKLLFPLVVFILPVVLIIVGGPILLQFMKGGIKF